MNDKQKSGNVKEKSNMITTITLLEELLNCKGMIHDADTILADILETADYEMTGIAADILQTYQDSTDKESLESFFHALTGITLETYLKKCIQTLMNQLRENAGIKMKTLLYHGHHFVAVGKCSQNEEWDIFFCEEDSKLYVTNGTELTEYFRRERRRQYADKHFMGRESAK